MQTESPSLGKGPPGAVDAVVAEHAQLGREQARVAVKVQHLLQQQAELAREADAVVVGHPHELRARRALSSAPAR